MKLQFNQNLPHQKAAWEAVVNLFEGQESCVAPFTMPQINSIRPGDQQFGLDYGSDPQLGTANRLVLSEDELLDNLKRVQLK
ncbi:hypothetical protein, partial [Thiomicrospira microaerophila]|uniref:hypothetical protein n=1 Tax=Thiomicrospira microaerophila TaxID=406020 RepID=UPI0005C98B73